MPSRTPNRIVWVIIGAVLLFEIGHLMGLTLFIESRIRNILNPLVEASYRMGQATQSLGSIITNSRLLTRENELLREQLGYVLAENAELKAYQQDLQSAEPILSFIRPLNRKLVLGRTISQSADPTMRIITVNKGLDDGIIIDTPAVIDRGFLIGKVVSVDDHSARIRLLLDSQSSTAALVEHGQGVPGLLVGEHGLSLRLTLIPKDQSVSSGDRVITSGLEALIPRGLIIGSVKDVSVTPDNLSQDASITPAISFDKISVVGFLTK